MIAAARIDDDNPIDRMLADLDTMREQLSAIESALPDYGPSFSALEQQTTSIKAQIDKIAAASSVQLTAAQHASKSAHAISDIISPSLARLQKAVESAEQRQSELGRLIGVIHIRSNHWQYVIMGPVLGLVLGFSIFPIFATFLPGGSHLAALATGHRDRWEAGQELMRAANPGALAAIVRASHVLAVSHEAIGRCTQSANATQRSQPCSIIVAPAPISP